METRERPIREPNSVNTTKTYHEGNVTIVETIRHEASGKLEYSYSVSLVGTSPLTFTKKDFADLRSIVEGI